MPLLFAATLFVSAFLLFLVQPMIAQMILPRLGGTPAVWNTCMVFFQAALLAGYGYTHSVTTYVPVRRQTLMQGGLLVLPFMFFLLPFSIGDWRPDTTVNPIWSVLIILLLSVGLPFFVVATSAPLLQRWFASTGHPSAKDPYFLYGASNLGSMLALISYPFFFQSNFFLPEIASIWMVSYGVMIAFVVACGLVVWRAPMTVSAISATKPDQEPAPVPVAAVAQSQQQITRRPSRYRSKPLTMKAVAPLAPIVNAAPEELTWLRRLRWVGLAAAPSSLMLGVTTYMTTDIAAIPLFWIVPLTLYLLSFILVFARWPVTWTGTPHRICVYLQPITLLFLGLTAFGAWNVTTFWMILAHLLAFFSCVMVCHGELAKDRPAAKHLTEFYLWMSVGGVLGGIFNSLIAPMVFKEIIEYFVILMAVVFLRPQTHFWDWIRGKKEPADDHSLEEYLLDIGYAVCLTLLAWGLLKLSLHQSLWKPAHDFTRWLLNFYEKSFTMNRASAYTWARWTELFIIEGIPCGICLAFGGRPIRFGLGILGLLIVNYFMLLYGDLDYIYKNRSFFSVQAVRREAIEQNDSRYEPQFWGRTYRVLIHGGIDHGRQEISDDMAVRDRPISYFLPTNPIGQVFSKMKGLDAAAPADKKLPFAVVGLGVGTLASYGNKDQIVDFYEIDPAVLRLSGYEINDEGKMLPLSDGSDPIFYYLHDALARGVKLNVKLGDGRLRIQEAPENSYQVIVLDAFSSDAIPVHLLTKEAISMYLTKLRPDGILLFNITNRYVKMAPALADSARELGLVCLQQADWGEERNPESFGTDWVIMFRSKTGNKMACDAAAATALPAAGLWSSVPWMDILASTNTGAPPETKDGPDTLHYLPALPKYDFPWVLPQLLDDWRWHRPLGTGRPAWTDHYQDLIRVMNWW